MKFTVVIPAYNAEKFISRAIQSALNQTFKDWELIIVNDGSTDDTERIILDTIKNDKAADIRIINQENKGLGAARNIGIKNSSGEYIALLDTDDIWYKEKLEAVYKVLSRMENIDVVCHDEYVVKESTGFKRRAYYGPKESCAYEDLLFKGNVLSSSATTIRREKLFEVGLFSENKDWHGVEDYDIWLKLAKIGAEFFFLNEVYGEYILHDENMSSSYDSFNLRALNLIEYHFSQLPNKSILKRYLLKRRKSRIYQESAFCLLKERKLRSAWGQLIKSFKN